MVFRFSTSSRRYPASLQLVVVIGFSVELYVIDSCTKTVCVMLGWFFLVQTSFLSSCRFT
jgi:hypothetical protein